MVVVVLDAVVDCFEIRIFYFMVSEQTTKASLRSS